MKTEVEWLTKPLTVPHRPVIKLPSDSRSNLRVVGRQRNSGKREEKISVIATSIGNTLMLSQLVLSILVKRFTPDSQAISTKVQLVWKFLSQY